MMRCVFGLASVVVLLAFAACEKREAPQTVPSASGPTAMPSTPVAESKKDLSDIKCPDAPEQLSRDIVIDAKGKIEGIAALPKASIEGKVSVISKDLLVKYPNADKLLLAKLVMNMTCEQLKNSSTISDSERLDRVNQLNVQIINLFSAVNEPDFRARATRVDFGKGLAGLVYRQIVVSKSKIPTLHVFDPECMVIVYVSTVLAPGEKSPLVSVAVTGEPMYAKPVEGLKHRFTVNDPIFRKAVDWILDDANHGGMADSGKGFLKGEARRGEQAIAKEDFEAVVVLRGEEVRRCEGSYYIDYET